MKAPLASRLMLSVIRLYQIAVSPLLAPRCRFLPTCSDYAVQAVQRHGAWYGGWLALRRVCRCHPFHPGGIDEVPLERSAPRRCVHRAARVERETGFRVESRVGSIPPGQ